MGCANLLRSYSRYMLIIFNLLFSVTGIILIAVGVSAKAYFNEFNTLLNQKFFYVSDLLIVIGVIIFIIAFFGCCGAMKENACMTSTYSALLIIVFLLEVAVGISGVLLNSRAETFLADTMKSTMDQYNTENATEVTEVWDGIQRKFHCCGVVNGTDWLNETNTHHQLPISCCPLPNGAVNNVTCDISNSYKQGCLQEFGGYVKDNISIVEVVAIGLAVVQLLGIIFSCCLTKFIRSDYETV
ncbi:unnamed protein product [Phaedon cochleariae]|uniref:Tetraspanin n=1 Tax=Phaedon cochleariae TaxID=80249 RepID=A0A9N9SE11_PHACE|nr:unnamed protein product [Phaedon cochleariae]